MEENKTQKKIEVVWVDSRQIHGWVLDNEIDNTTCMVHSCGYLINESEDALTLALSIASEPSQANGINVIPKCCIVKCTEL